jgi:hypothetical protein
MFPPHLQRELTMITPNRCRDILFCAVLGTLGTASAAVAEEEQDSEAPNDAPNDQITIRGVTASGSGCPAGSWAFILADDQATVNFSQYFLEADASKPTLQSLACNVSLTLNVPTGYSVGVSRLSYSGYAYLAQGVTAEQLVNYAWTGVGTISNNEAKHVFAGPYDSEYVVTDHIETRGAGIQWSPCDIRSNLQIRTRLVLNNPERADGYFKMDSIGGEQGSELGIRFVKKKC